MSLWKGVNQLVTNFSDIVPQEGIDSSIQLFSLLGISSTFVWFLGKLIKCRFEQQCDQMRSSEGGEVQVCVVVSGWQVTQF